LRRNLQNVAPPRKSPARRATDPARRSRDLAPAGADPARRSRDPPPPGSDPARKRFDPARKSFVQRVTQLARAQGHR
jgi:hypothetical protein